MKFLLVPLSLFILLLYLIFFFPPTYQIRLNTITIPIFIPFFLLLFFTVAGFTGLLFKNTLQGMVFGVFCVGYVLLRLFGFTHWFFLLLLVILFALIEIILLKSR